MTMTEITDEDIGKEGRFTWDGKWPAVVVKATIAADLPVIAANGSLKCRRPERERL